MINTQEKRATIIRILPGAGHVTAALIYVTMGILAGFLAAGWGGHSPDLRGTVWALREQPFGPLLLLLVALGSSALMFWRLLQAIADLECKGATVVGIFQRGRYFLSALFYGGLPILIYRTLVGAPVPSSDHWARQIASRVVALPFGWTLLVAAGLGFFVYTAVCAYRLFSGNFERWFHCENMTERQQTVLFAFGRLGYAARGFISMVVGYCIIQAGWHVNPTEVAGQAGALYRVFHQPFGPLLLGGIALGLISLGLFSLGTARFGKVPVERVNQLINFCKRPVN